jgi:hypothetical protein
VRISVWEKQKAEGNKEGKEGGKERTHEMRKKKGKEERVMREREGGWEG